MADRVTIQDIADALNLSRNTVSKAINNTGVIADSTRAAVLKKAAELGYKQFSYFDMNAILPGITARGKSEEESILGEVVFLTTGRMDNSHFGSVMLDKIVHEFALLHYTVTLHRVLPTDLEMLRLPQSVDLNKVKGIICVEMLNEDYCRMLAASGIPLLFVDEPVYVKGPRPEVDILLMDNEHCIYDFIQQMKERGFTRFGFMGDIRHCRSFSERYRSFRLALEVLRLPFDENVCLQDDLDQLARHDHERYLEKIYEWIRGCERLPEVMICANDFVALDLITVLRDMHYRVPEDVRVLGFDDSSESRIFTPALSSIHIHTQIMGQYAANILFRRIKYPDLYHVTVHTETDLICRASTQGG